MSRLLTFPPSFPIYDWGLTAFLSFILFCISSLHTISRHTLFWSVKTRSLVRRSSAGSAKERRPRSSRGPCLLQHLAFQPISCFPHATAAKASHGFNLFLTYSFSLLLYRFLSLVRSFQNKSIPFMNYDTLMLFLFFSFLPFILCFLYKFFSTSFLPYTIVFPSFFMRTTGHFLHIMMTTM